MMRSILLSCALLGASVLSSAAAQPVPFVVGGPEVHSGTATVTDASPGGTVLIGLSCPATWGTGGMGHDGIIFHNPDGGDITYIDGQGGVSVDIDGNTCTISNGSSFITLSLQEGG